MIIVYWLAIGALFGLLKSFVMFRGFMREYPSLYPNEIYRTVFVDRIWTTLTLIVLSAFMGPIAILTYIMYWIFSKE